MYTVLHVLLFFFFSSRRRHTRFKCDWSSDVCSSDLNGDAAVGGSLSQGGIDVVDPDGGQHARDSLGVEPCAAHVSCGVIEAWVRRVAVPDIPTEYFLIESNGPGGVGRRNLQIGQAGATQFRDAAGGRRNLEPPCV